MLPLRPVAPAEREDSRNLVVRRTDRDGAGSDLIVEVHRFAPWPAVRSHYVDLLELLVGELRRAVRCDMYLLRHLHHRLGEQLGRWFIDENAPRPSVIPTARGLSEIKRLFDYRLEEISWRAGWPCHLDHEPSAVAFKVAGLPTPMIDRFCLDGQRLAELLAENPPWEEAVPAVLDRMRDIHKLAMLGLACESRAAPLGLALLGPSTPATPGVAVVAGNRPDPGDDFMDIEELARLLRVSERTIRRRVQDGTLPPGIRVGHCRRWSRREVFAWLGQR